jgi:hypothetical protein
LHAATVQDVPALFIPSTELLFFKVGEFMDSLTLENIFNFNNYFFKGNYALQQRLFRLSGTTCVFNTSDWVSNTSTWFVGANWRGEIIITSP